MAKVDLKAKLSGFKEDILSKPVETPIQKVVPVSLVPESKQLKKGSIQISAYLDEQLLEDVKIKLIKEKKKLSPLIEKLLSDWLNSK